MVHGRHGRRGARWPLLGLGGLGAVAAVIVVALGIGQVAGGRACAAVVAGAATTAGTATHYVLSGTGNCSYPSPPVDGLFVALSSAEYHGAACGGYIEDGPGWRSIRTSSPAPIRWPNWPRPRWRSRCGLTAARRAWAP